MKVGAEDKRKRIIAGVFGFFALLALYPLYQELFGGPSAPPPAPPVIVSKPSVSAPNAAAGTAAEKVGTSSAPLDPTLHMEAMLRTESLVYSGSGRNIFSGEAAAPQLAFVAPKSPSPRTTPVVYTPPVNVGPPPPPPIGLKFFGTATTPNGNRRAFLLSGDDVFLAGAGEIVQRRYKVVSVSANSILIEDLTYSNQQSLPLLVNQ